jgi:hypothetical protein
MDRSSQYDWDWYNKGHIMAHQVEPHEFEEVLANEPIYIIETRIDTESGEKEFSNWVTPIVAACCSLRGRLAASGRAR